MWPLWHDCEIRNARRSFRYQETGANAEKEKIESRSQYSNEAYDYPPNIRESFGDLSRTISEKVTLLSQASSPTEAQAALTGPPTAKPQPKTFNHALARASLSGSQLLEQSLPSSGSGAEEPLSNALEKYALAQERVGEARLAQDHQIQQRFLAGWNTTLNTNLMFATKARRNVENARLALDATKAKAGKKGASATPSGDIVSSGVSDELRAEIEKKEDEFVGVTEEAVGVMRNVCISDSSPLSLLHSWDMSSNKVRNYQVLDTPEPLRNIADLIAAQLDFYKRAGEILGELAPVVDGLQVEQETNYRKSREGS